MAGVAAATVTAMVEAATESRRIYDVVIFGASGFTGKYVIREALKHLSVPTSPLKTIALAGRSTSKVSAALQWAASTSTPPSIPIIQADVFSRSSLVALCRQTRVLLNCVGPFRHYGEPVVSACVESGTDYLDITGEPEFMERIEMEYHAKAAEAGCLVVSACGFDSIPAEIGVIFNSRQWVGASAPNRINAYLKLESEKGIVGNLGTLESAVLGVANSKNLQELRRSRPRRASPVIPGGLPEGALIDHQKDVGLWAVKLPSADATVVRRTLSILTENPRGLVGVEETEEDSLKRERFWSTVKPAHFSVKLSSKSLLGTILHVFLGTLFGLFTSFSFGRSLIVKYPEVFTFGSFRKTGPTEEEVLCSSFKMWFVGEGYSDAAVASSQTGSKLDTRIITRISGPELGYVATPIALVQCALVLLADRTKLPKGGVYPPGVVFGATDLQKRLQENGISFDVISRKTPIP